jgi:hypothetical protein
MAALQQCLPRLGDSRARAELREGLEARRASEADDPRSLWRGAGAAGLLAAFDRPGEAPERAFGEASLAWLGLRTPGVAAAVLAGDPAVAADSLDAWLRAIAAAGATDATRGSRDERVLGMIDVLVRRGAAMDCPGTAADAAGSLVDSLADADRGRIGTAFARWLLDPAVGARSLHGLTSVLATRRPAPWWDPWLVCDPRADATAREATADRYRAALAAAGAVAAGPAPARIRGARPESVARWARVAREVLGRPAVQDLPGRMARVAQLAAALESLVLLERGRGAEADARLAQLEDEAALAPRDNGRWKDGIEAKDVGRVLGPDGRLEEDLRRLHSQDQRIEYLRRLRTRPMSDLGPADAVVLAREALGARGASTRSVVQDVIADQYPLGPNVIAALAAEVPFASEPAEAVALAQRLTGKSVPAGSTADRRAAAALLLLDLHAALVPADRHRVDAVARELAQAANAAAAAAGGRAPGAMAMPEVALRAWFDAALESAREALPAPTVARLSAQADARRRLALPGPQAAVAEAVGLLEVEAAVDVERRPRGRAATEAVSREAAEARRSATDAVAQLDATVRALLRLQIERIAGTGGGA